jgi:hypothetical protein
MAPRVRMNRKLDTVDGDASRHPLQALVACLLPALRALGAPNRPRALIHKLIANWQRAAQLPVTVFS